MAAASDGAPAVRSDFRLRRVGGRRDWLGAAAADDVEGSAVRGIIGEMIDAPMEWATLVDVALGATAQDIAVTSLDRFADWLKPWAATDAGKGALATGGRIGVVAAGEIPVAPEPDLAADFSFSSFTESASTTIDKISFFARLIAFAGNEVEFSFHFLSPRH
jgi:hypothetical protein